MQTADFINKFREKLDTEAMNIGFERMRNGQLYPNDVQSFYGGYIFKDIQLTYKTTYDSLNIYLNPDSPRSALVAGMNHAINPNVTVEEHESRLQKQASFTWNEKNQIWNILNKFYGTDLPGQSTLDTENLVDYCIQSLLNYR